MKAAASAVAVETAALPLDERYPLVPASPAGLAEAAMSCGRRGDVITAPWCSSVQCCARGHHRRPAGVDGVDDLARIDPLQVGAGGPEVGMPELSLDYVDWHPLPGKLDRVRMPQLVRREPAANTRLGGEAFAVPPGTAVAGHARPRVGPSMMQNSGPTGSRTRSSSQRFRCSNPQSSIPTSRRLSPFPCRISTDPRAGSTSVSLNASASEILSLRATARRSPP